MIYAFNAVDTSNLVRFSITYTIIVAGISAYILTIRRWEFIIHQMKIKIPFFQIKEKPDQKKKLEEYGKSLGEKIKKKKGLFR